MKREMKKPKRVKTHFDVIGEKQFTDQVIALARWHKWRVYHARPALTKAGRWVTAMQGDIGFPDLCMAHAERGLVIFAELKAEGGRLSPKQIDWIDVLGECQNGGPGAGVLVYVWRPSDVDVIETILKG